ncbi:hypothetical protein VTG60DRAFT_1130 [Thermothelomyces hinnuleus]
MLQDVSNGLIPAPPTFLQDASKALHAILVHAILSITGVYAVQLNFLLIALVQYRCMLGPLHVIVLKCTTIGEVARQHTYTIVYCTMDAASDVLIVCLPAVILWEVRLTIRKKLVLAVIFSLSLVTVAVTIIRGAIPRVRVKVTADGSQTRYTAWTVFWLSLEFITAYITSCLVSFRVLFVHNQRSSSAARAHAHSLAPGNNRHALLIPSSHPNFNSSRGYCSSRRKRCVDILLDTLYGMGGGHHHHLPAPRQRRHAGAVGEDAPGLFEIRI